MIFQANQLNLKKSRLHLWNLEVQNQSSCACVYPGSKRSWLSQTPYKLLYFQGVIFTMNLSKSFKRYSTCTIKDLWPWFSSISPVIMLVAPELDHDSAGRWPGPWFNIKMPSYQYRKSHCGDKSVVRSSYLHNGISYAGKMAYSYWITSQVLGNQQQSWWPSQFYYFGYISTDQSLVSRRSQSI